MSASKWIELKNVALSEIIQTEKNYVYLLSCVGAKNQPESRIAVIRSWTGHWRGERRQVGYLCQNTGKREK